MVWLPDADEDGSAGAGLMGQQVRIKEQRNYDVEYYVALLRTSYAQRLHKAFTPDAFAQLFRIDGQAGLWDLPLDQIEPIKIQCHELPVPESGIESA
jgi:hypothetical protein